MIASISFGLNVYPLVNWVDAKPGQEVTLNLRLTAGPNGDYVKMALKDFVIVNGVYIYDKPGYPYSLRNYITLPSTELRLKPGEVYEMPVKIKIPADYKGAQGFAAISFEGNAIKRGNILINLKIMAIILVNVQNRRILDIKVSGVKAYSLSSEGVSESFKRKYGDFGTIVEIKLRNDGNLVFAPNGEARIISRKLGRVVATYKLDSSEFVVFPSLEGTLTLYTPSVLPSGDLILQLEAVSQKMRIAKSFSFKGPEHTFKGDAVSIEPDIMFFKADRPINAKFRIQNLTENRFQIEVGIKSPIRIFPSKTWLMPYSGMNFFLVLDPRKAKLESGDNVYRIEVRGEKELRVVKGGVVVVRKGSMPPSFEVEMTSYSSDTSTGELLIRNTGKMCLEFSVIERKALGDNVLVKSFMVLPGESKKVEFKHTLTYEQAKNAVFLRYRVYGEKEWTEQPLPWKE